MGLVLLFENGCSNISLCSSTHSCSIVANSSKVNGSLLAASANSFKFSSLVMFGRTDLMTGVANEKRIAACPIVRLIPL